MTKIKKRMKDMTLEESIEIAKDAIEYNDRCDCENDGGHGHVCAHFSTEHPCKTVSCQDSTVSAFSTVIADLRARLKVAEEKRDALK